MRRAPPAMNPDGTLFLRVDGRPVDPAAPAIAASDRGFGYGDGVFRTVRLSGGRIAAWPRHAAKLRADLSRLHLPAPDLARIEADLADLAAAHPDCVARITVTAGMSARGYRRDRNAPACIVVRAAAAPAGPPEASTAGIALHLCRLRLSDQPMLAGVKHLNRLEQVLARAEWDDAEVPEGLTLDATGHAICGTMSNLFIVEGGRMATPDLSRCGVEGVQRARILDWARASGIDCTVEPLPLARVLAADAVVLCNSVVGAWWVNRLQARTYERPAWHPALVEHLADDAP